MSQAGIILCVDDDSTVLAALRSVLSSHFGSEMEFEFAESGDEALEIDAELRAQGRELGLVISDFMMPGLRGDELLVRLHATSPNTVKILLTGQSDLTGVKRAINDANLYRFLEKPFLNEDIVLTVRAAIKSYRQERDLIRQNEELRRLNAELEDIVQARTLELVEKNRELEQLSVTDKLTGLANRRKLDQVLEEEFIRARRYDVEFSVAIMDIDHFKVVNDGHGHATGDVVLEAMARILRQQTRDADVLARWAARSSWCCAGTPGCSGAWPPPRRSARRSPRMPSPASARSPPASGWRPAARTTASPA